MELKIAICDDEEKYRSLLHERIVKDSFGSNYELIIDEYACSKELEAALDKCVDYDVYFLDIQMENGTDDGIRTARTLRNRGKKGLIIYVTSFIDYVQVGYEVKAFRYLLKSQLETELKRVLDDIRKELVGEEFFSFRINGDAIRVNKSDIMYLESDRRQIKLYTSGNLTEEYCFYGSLDDIETKLGESFMRCHRSYVVNVAYIKRWSGEQIELNCGVTVPVSRSYAKDVKQRLMLEMI